VGNALGRALRFGGRPMDIRHLFAIAASYARRGASGKGFCLGMVAPVLDAAVRGPCGLPADATPFLCNNLPSPCIRYVIETTKVEYSLCVCWAGSHARAMGTPDASERGAIPRRLDFGVRLHPSGRTPEQEVLTWQLLVPLI
jgi:hypothetical protein